jgi:iron complex outermembrane receptor protein
MRLQAIFTPALLLLTLPALAQQTTRKESVTVVGEAEPVLEGQTSRSVTTLDPHAAASLADALRTDASVDIQMRGPMGVQSDVTVRGGTC